MSDRAIDWVSAFSFTQVIEIPIYVLIFRCTVARAFGASAWTHPLIWFGIFHPDVPGNYALKIVIAESFAWLGEAAYWRAFPWKRALLGSLVANTASLAIGLGTRALFGWP